MMEADLRDRVPAHGGSVALRGVTPDTALRLRGEGARLVVVKGDGEPPVRLRQRRELRCVRGERCPTAQAVPTAEAVATG